ncbi:hypothetical protein GUITHDRAFT_160884 [Guillardia theta CCMP2712]|uniref:Uncharacterized protein n=1 Tax=Guillardia theta (strain CCMP2712) TaxID=905079 RepID=L1JYZ9_GUITC|nr:hypothetical protein GUITHDRAFT_160884 [Guillardia theta CCMP2712]EKX53607.1 hypothetical protein GUITHDRAFT_160884 [Guillardia theta CCMP2712]|eukprot:XP_005840587.1 hypothetical protein GUITHDRAFT_160884 [Guillardia theta CCMP2712]
MQLAWRAFGRRKMAICAAPSPPTHHNNTCNYSSVSHGHPPSVPNSFILQHSNATNVQIPFVVCRVKAARASCMQRRLPTPHFVRGGISAAGIRQFSSMQNKAGKLFVSGWSNSGALGLGKDVVKAKQPTEIPIPEPVIDVSCGKKFTVFVTESGKVYSMGDNKNGELGNPNAGSSSYEPTIVHGLDGIKIVKIAAGQYHVLALSDIGEVYSWGWGGSGTPGAGVGALGHGDKASLPVPKRIERLNGEKITNISCGAKHSVALSQDGTMFTWGHGEQGRLGHGNNTDFLQPEPISESPVRPWQLRLCKT